MWLMIEIIEVSVVIAYDFYWLLGFYRIKPGFLLIVKMIKSGEEQDLASMDLN